MTAGAGAQSGLDPSSIFTAVALLGLLRMPLMQIPQVLSPLLTRIDSYRLGLTHIDSD
jgi:hypothetical protein